MAGLKLVHVPYKGTALAMTDLVAGHINMLFGDPMALWPYVTDNKVRAIGVSSLKRYPAAPDVPTLAELGLAGFESGVWYGLVGPAGMPPALVDSINATVRQVMRDAEMEKRFTSFGSSVVASTPADFQAQIQSDLAKWKAAVASNPILKE
jgi:tripartite-type tricarboxylate transporter receptor subunit TctC